MTNATARNDHEMLLENCHETDNTKLSLVLANAQQNPTEHQVKHLYEIWRNSNFGSRDEDSMIKVLKEKIDFYKKEKQINIVIKENPLIVIILSRIMMRAHNEDFAREIVFVDSNGSCDQTNSCVTFMFCTAKIAQIARYIC
ncbi:unnamed protein product [Psylliodes chrysocephalus]|uniref:Uncharacterized protein n=1 Tax=Psylliodes chrysocephalus TaxID=3402493 RepID=A0A9P0CPA6_9CUCU|nr:unnamed protein product [Psylliodes chrysocephala]